MTTTETAKEFMRRLEGQRFHEAFGMLADDGKYTVIGTTCVSRVYNGPQDIFENLIPVLSTFKVAPKLAFDPPVIEGDRAVILGRGEGVGPTGDYHQPFYAFVTRVVGDRFSEIIEFMDTQMLQTAAFGKILEDNSTL